MPCFLEQIYVISDKFHYLAFLLGRNLVHICNVNFRLKPYFSFRLSFHHMYMHWLVIFIAIEEKSISICYKNCWHSTSKKYLCHYKRINSSTPYPYPSVPT